MTTIINVAFVVSLSAAALAFVFHRRDMKRLSFVALYISVYASGVCCGVAIISAMEV